MGYKHLNIDERESILKMLSEQKNMTDIAELLGRNKGTISRELSRNLSSTGKYKPHLAQRYYNKRRDASKQPYRLEQDGKLRRYVRKKLKRYWSPEQIAGRLKQDCKIDVSSVTIYCWIMRDKAEGGRLYKYLRQSNRKRRKRYGSCEKRGQIPDRRPIISVQLLSMSVNALAIGNLIRLSARAGPAILPAMWNAKAGI